MPLAVQNRGHAAFESFQVGRLCFQHNLVRPVRSAVVHLDRSRGRRDGDDILGGDEAREPFPKLVHDDLAVFIREAVLLVERDDHPLSLTGEPGNDVAIDPGQVVVDNINHEVGAPCRANGQELAVRALLARLAEARRVRQQKRAVDTPDRVGVRLADPRGSHRGARLACCAAQERADQRRLTHRSGADHDELETGA